MQGDQHRCNCYCRRQAAEQHLRRNAAESHRGLDQRETRQRSSLGPYAAIGNSTRPAGVGPGRHKPRGSCPPSFAVAPRAPVRALARAALARGPCAADGVAPAAVGVVRRLVDAEAGAVREAPGAAALTPDARHRATAAIAARSAVVRVARLVDACAATYRLVRRALQLADARDARGPLRA